MIEARFWKLAVLVALSPCSLAAQNEPKGQLLPDPYAATSSYSMLTVMAQNHTRVVIHVNGNILMDGYNEKDELVFSLYADGHVEYADKREVTEITKFFWKTLADSFESWKEQACQADKRTTDEEARKKIEKDRAR